MTDNSATFAFDVTNSLISTKPHGHGDIHSLLFSSGVAERWRDMGKEWMIFIQDTNATALRTIPSILGVSRVNNWEMNSICVPRMPGESMGAICRLIKEGEGESAESGEEIVINVEYN